MLLRGIAAKHSENHGAGTSAKSKTVVLSVIEAQHTLNRPCSKSSPTCTRKAEKI